MACRSLTVAFDFISILYQRGVTGMYNGLREKGLSRAAQTKGEHYTVDHWASN